MNSSVSNVVTLQRVQDLPLQNLDAGALIALQPGVVGDNFNGVRSQSQNVTLDGVNIQETRYNGGLEQRQHDGHQQRRSDWPSFASAPRLSMRSSAAAWRRCR